jgi:hypothetical protein
VTLGSSIVRDLLSFLDKEPPLRRIAAVCFIVLAGFAYADRSDFDTGVLAWSHEVACQYDQIISKAFRNPDLPTVKVHATSGACGLIFRAPTEPAFQSRLVSGSPPG